MRIAVYPGSFDPITNGHIDILQRATNVFDKIYITILHNPQKMTLFSVEERMEIIRSIVKDNKTIEVSTYDGLLVDYADRIGAQAIIRGIRAVSDFDYEFQLALTNRKLKNNIDTVFFMTGENYSFLSSGLVKQICFFGGDISSFVPPVVEEKLNDKYASERSRV